MKNIDTIYWSKKNMIEPKNRELYPFVKEFVEESDKRALYREIKEKSYFRRSIPFRKKDFLNKEELALALKNTTMLEGMFAYEMYEIERDFSEEDAEKHITCQCKNAVSKARRIYNLVIMLAYYYDIYENNHLYEDLIFLYNIFLVLMEELKGTTKEKCIKEYTYFFEHIFSVK